MYIDYPAFKEKKFFLIAGWSNHPNRLPSITLSGTLTHDDDRRDTEIGLTATRTVKEIDFTTFTPWVRVYRGKIPLLSLPTDINGDSEFSIFAPSFAPWSATAKIGGTPDTTCGTSTFYEYSRATDEDPWVEDSSTPTDIVIAWTPSIDGGGHPVSGGKGADDEDNSIQISNWPNVFGNISSVAVYRLPWENPWASESALFSATFDDDIDDLNTADGGGHSGSCTFSVSFS